MNKIVTIAKWEFLEKLRKKSFFVFTLFFPILIILLSIIPSAISNTNWSDKTHAIGIVDESGVFYSHIRKDITENMNNLFMITYNFTNRKNVGNLQIALDDLESGTTAGLIVINVNKTQHYSIKFISNRTLPENVEQQILLQTENSILQASLNKFNESFKIQKDYISTSSSDETSLEQFIKSFVFLILLITATLSNGGTFARGFVEEKSNGLMEILLSSCNVSTLFYGKLFGIVLIGLFQTLIWFGAGLIFTPDLLLPFSGFTIQFLYFILGYIFFSSIFLGAGSVLKTEYETQQLTTLISLILIIPLLLSFYLLTDINSTLSHVLTYFPLTTAPVMLIKTASGNFEFHELVTTLAITVISIIFSISISSALYKASYSKGNIFRIISNKRK